MPCPYNWTLNRYYCYKYFEESKPFEKARKDCESYGAELVSLRKTSIAEHEWELYRYLSAKAKKPNNGIWVGLQATYRKEFKRISDQASFLDSKYWCPGYPKIGYPEKSCIKNGLDECGDRIIDVDCKEKNTYICMKFLENM